MPHPNTNWTIADAKARLSEVVEKARLDGPQIITKNGRSTAVLVSIEEWERKTAFWLRKMITIDTTASGKPITDSIGSTPVLIRLHDGDFRFNYAKPDGSDLRFIAADDKTPLAFHIEKFDSLLLNEAFVWVNVPDLKPGTKTSFWLYYGNGGPKAVKGCGARRSGTATACPDS